MTLNNVPGDVIPSLADDVADSETRRGDEHRALPVLAIACYVVSLGGVFAPWLSLGNEVGGPVSSSRSMWDTGLSDCGSGNSVVVLAVLGVGLRSWCLARQRSHLQRAAGPLFIALFVIAARQLMAYGEIPSRRHWSFLIHVVGWGLMLVLVASAVGIVVSIRWHFVTHRTHGNVRGDETEQVEAPKVQRSINYLGALIVLSIVEVAFSQATWLNIDEVSGRTFRFTIRGDSNYGPGTVAIVIGLVLILVCVWQLRTPYRRSPVAPSALVFANLVVLANFYVAEANPPSFHDFIFYRVQWGFLVTLGATALFLIVLVAWWWPQHRRPSRSQTMAVVGDGSTSLTRRDGTTAAQRLPLE